MRSESALLSSCGLRRRRLRAFDFDSRLCLRCCLRAMTFPVPVTLNRFADPLCVLSLGTDDNLLLGGTLGLALAADVLCYGFFGSQYDRHLPPFHMWRPINQTHFRKYLGDA